MPRVEIVPALPDDAEGLSRLLAESTGETGIAIALDDPEDFWRIMDVRGTEWRVFVGRTRESSLIAGEGTMAHRACYVNGEERRVFHLISLYFSPAYRRGTLLGQAFRLLREQLLRGDDFAQTTVSEGNVRALSAFTSARGGLPAYHPYGEHAYITAALHHRSGPAPRVPPGFEVRRARASDLSALQAAFDAWAPLKQFYPRYDFSRLAAGGDPYYRGLRLEDFLLAFRHGRLIGITGTWDQRGFKSIHLADPSVPRAAAPRSFFLHSVVVADNDPAIFHALLEGIRLDPLLSQYAFFALGLDARDPLRQSLGHLRHESCLAHQFLVTFGKDPREALKPGLFYLEAARC